MPKVLIVATSKKTHGGITAVIKAHEIGEQWKKYHCHWVQTHRDGSNLVKIVYLMYALVDYIFRLPYYDIVHIHFSHPVSAKRKVIFAKLAKLFHKKLILHLHCGNIHEIWNSDYDFLFSSADKAIFLSKKLQCMVEEHIGKSYTHQVIYNPCPIVNVAPIHNLKNEIVYFGILNDKKGYQDLLKAFAKIALKYPQWNIIFAGNGDIEKGKMLAQSLNVTQQVKFLGWVTGDEKQQIFCEASIFCLPSYTEGFPMAVLDAWAYGLPVITTPVGGIPDVARDGENMLLFNPGDIDMLSKQLERMMEDGNLRAKIAKASNDFAITTFSIDAINRQIGDLYEKLSNS